MSTFFFMTINFACNQTSVSGQSFLHVIQISFSGQSILQVCQFSFQVNTICRWLKLFQAIISVLALKIFSSSIICYIFSAFKNKNRSRPSSITSDKYFQLIAFVRQSGNIICVGKQNKLILSTELWTTTWLCLSVEIWQASPILSPSASWI